MPRGGSEMLACCCMRVLHERHQGAHSARGTRTKALEPFDQHDARCELRERDARALMLPRAPGEPCSLRKRGSQAGELGHGTLAGGCYLGCRPTLRGKGLWLGRRRGRRGGGGSEQAGRGGAGGLGRHCSRHGSARGGVPLTSGNTDSSRLPMRGSAVTTVPTGMSYPDSWMGSEVRRKPPPAGGMVRRHSRSTPAGMAAWSYAGPCVM